jgi:histone deacetylase 1/2
MENLNSPQYLEQTKIQLMEVLRGVEPVPSAQIQTGQVESQLNPRGLNMEIDEPDEEEKLADAEPDLRVTNEMIGRKEGAVDDLYGPSDQ